MVQPGSSTGRAGSVMPDTPDRMTPEAQATYALNHRLPREVLDSEAQAIYDHLVRERNPAGSEGAASEPERDTVPMLIMTTNEVPGHRITHVHGDVFGLIVRARNYFSNLGASFRTLAGGEVAGYTRLLTDSRNQARERMWRQARARGANAVVAMRFDCNEIGGIMSEVAAYGTAVTIEPRPSGPATARADAVGPRVLG